MQKQQDLHPRNPLCSLKVGNKKGCLPDTWRKKKNTQEILQSVLSLDTVNKF